MEECELALNRTGIPESARISDGLRIPVRPPERVAE
jgi:hypothetical protein